ncbi:MAG: hypothetical protein ACRDPY_21515 [Streptosporangiaceae bacterium]
MLRPDRAGSSRTAAETICGKMPARPAPSSAKPAMAVAGVPISRPAARPRPASRPLARTSDRCSDALIAGRRAAQAAPPAPSTKK